MLLVLSRCEGSPTPANHPKTSATLSPINQSKVLSMSNIYSYTHQKPNGNRLLEGQGDFPNARSIDIELAGTPQWPVAAPLESGSIWVVALEDGAVQAFLVRDGQVVETKINPPSIPAGAPPLLATSGGEAFLFTGPADSASAITHAVPLGESGRLAFVESGGDLVLWENGSEIGRLAVDALPDARLLADGQERVLLLTKPSSRYPHGIAGGTLEAPEITLMETSPSLQVVTQIFIPGQRVVEGISPIWADLNGDGQWEIIVTLSDAEQGAQVVVYSESGEQVAAGPAVGRGNRWRHQIAVAPFGPNGELELAEVLTPHIGGIAGFYRMDGDSLNLVAQQDGVTSHPVFSPNLYMGLAGDLDGDGQLELVVFDQPFREVVALRRTPDGVAVAWRATVDGKAVTNLASVESGAGISLGCRARRRGVANLVGSLDVRHPFPQASRKMPG